MKRCAVFVLLSGAVLCHGAEPPTSRHVGLLPARQLASPPDLRVQLGRTSIELEATTLHQVTSMTSVGSIRHAGDAGGSRYWVGGVTMGAAASSLARMLGSADAWSDGWHGYSYSVKIPGICGGGGDADQGGSIAAKVVGGKVVELTAGRTTEC